MRDDLWGALKRHKKEKFNADRDAFLSKAVKDDDVEARRLGEAIDQKVGNDELGPTPGGVHRSLPPSHFDGPRIDIDTQYPQTDRRHEEARRAVMTANVQRPLPGMDSPGQRSGHDIAACRGVVQILPVTVVF